MEHSKYSASGSERWLKCPGSIKLSEGIPEPFSKYADEGTKAHKVLSLVLESFLKTGSPKIATASVAKLAPKSMITHALKVCERVTSRMTEDSFLMIDTKVEVPGVGFGTLDIAIIEEFGVLTVIDYKYGQGVVVEAFENTQAIYYAIGMARLYHYAFEHVRLVIDQPRAYHPRGPVREWFIPIEELHSWYEVLRSGVRKAEKPKPELRAGEHCRFCRAILICPEIKNKRKRETQDDFPDD